jgi:UDP-N-acetylmuramate--alanine ligase
MLVILSAHYDDEFIASDAVNRAVVEYPADDPRGVTDEAVPGVMTVVVVDVLETVHVAYRDGERLILPGGDLIMHTGLKMKPATQDGVTTWTYSQDAGDFHAENVRIGGGAIVFDLVSPLGNIKDICLGVPVMVNIENGIAAIALAQIAGVPAECIREGMASFAGVDRRFDFHVRRDDMVYLSDYGHHPEEVRKSLTSIRMLYEGRRIKVIFQPHLYTRTRDFYKEFADALSLVKDIALVDIYPARELPIEGVTSALIAENLQPDVKCELCHKEDVLDIVRRKDFDVLVTLGAGDLDNYADDITSILNA